MRADHASDAPAGLLACRFWGFLCRQTASRHRTDILETVKTAQGGGSRRLRAAVLAPAVLTVALAGAVAFLAWQHFSDILAIVGRVGWGLAALPLLYLFPLACSTAAWRVLLPARAAPRVRTLTIATWIGLAANDLLPGGGITGEVARARLAMAAGVPGRIAGASLVLDKTAHALAIVLLGAAAAATLPLLGASRDVILVAGVGWLLLAVAVVGFVLVQRAGLFGGLARASAITFGGGRLLWLLRSGRRLDREIRGLYRARGRLALACALKLGFWLGLVVEVWLIAQLVHEPIGFLDAFMIEGLSAVLRAAAFIVPAAIGVQEGSFVLLGAIVGYDPALMLVLVLIKRGREILLGVPALALWQAAEGRSVWSAAWRQRPMAGLEPDAERGERE